MTLEMQLFNEGHRQQWDEFVNQHPEGRFSQLAGYKDVVEKTYGYSSVYRLFVTPEGRVAAVFPAFVKKSCLMGNKLISQPFCEYGGLLVDNLGREECSCIKDKLSDLLSELKLPFCEMHGGMGLPDKNRGALFPHRLLHQYAVLELSSSEVWEDKVDRMVRKAVRKAERSGLECYQDITETAIINDFYPLYLHAMKRFGTPPHPKTFFLNCQRYLAKDMKLFLVKYRGRVIAALLGFTTGKRVHIINTVSDERHWDKRPNDLAHWHFIEWASNNGYHFFDFGPVRYGGQRQFKEKWGAEFFDYYYFFISQRENGNMPKPATHSVGVRYFAWAWGRLLPLPVTEVIGPWFRKQLGD